MKVSKRTEDEIRRSMLLPEQNYEVRVVSADNKPSKSGNEMITLTLQIIDENGKSFLVKDYLVSSMELKVLHAAAAFGLMEKYNSGNIEAEDFIDKAAIAAIKIREATDKYGASNFVEDYYTNKNEAALGKSFSVVKESSPLDDEITF